MNTIKTMELPGHATSAKCVDCSFAVNSNKDPLQSAEMIQAHMKLHPEHKVQMTVTRALMWYTEKNEGNPG